MNPKPHIILNDVKKKEYLINDGRLFFKIHNNYLKNKNEILICSYNSENNHLVPEILMKYESNVLLFDIIIFNFSFS